MIMEVAAVGVAHQIRNCPHRPAVHDPEALSVTIADKAS